MFSFQDRSSKRRREDDSDSEDGDGYGYGYMGQQLKKSRTWFSDPIPRQHSQNTSQSSLPLRPSPTPPRIISDVEALTPVHSDHEETASPDSPYGGPVQSSPSHLSNYDMDMDEDDFDITSQPPLSPFANNLFMRPAMLNASLFSADSVSTNSRIPTPIHPTFKRAGMTGLGFPTSGSAGGLHTTTNDIPTMQIPPIRKPARPDHDENRNRRMPSPISEDEDIPDTPTALTQSQLSRLSFSQDLMDTEMPSTTLTLPPTPRGRKRSGALTGMGRFSMGYRDDCEKCRLRVPGHYSHFLP